MSPRDDDDFFVEEFHGLPYAEVEVPPKRYAVPAWTLPPLERLTLVTVGAPGWWLVDELAVVGTVDKGDGQTWYEVIPHAEWGASLLRVVQEHMPEGEQRVSLRVLPASELWVYQDGVGETVSVDKLEPFNPLAWFDRRMESTTEPPQVMTPRPARELPSLVGRKLRVRTPEGWFWMMGLSEPIQSHPADDYTVTLCHASDYWRAAYGRPTTGRTWLYRYPLHCVWTY